MSGVVLSVSKLKVAVLIGGSANRNGPLRAFFDIRLDAEFDRLDRAKGFQSDAC
jgi:hypothetical protein